MASLPDVRGQGLGAVLPPPEEAARAAPRPVRRRRVRWFALRRDIPQPAYLGLAVSSFLLVLAFWAWASHQDFVNPIFMPPPEKVLDAAVEFAKDSAIRQDIQISFFRVTAGFVLSALIAIPLGILIGAFKVGEGIVQPLAEFVRYIPVPALVPLMMVMFGIGEMPKVMLIFAGTFFQMLLMVSEEVRRVPYDLVQVSYTLGASRGEIISKVLWPAALPGVFDALRLCNGWAWTYLVVAELVAANEGLGYRILKFSRYLQTSRIFVYLILLGVIGLTLDLLFRPGEEAPVSVAKLEIRAVEKIFEGRFKTTQALAPTSFSIADGEFVSLVGPSGCGKSTLLYVVAGLEDASSGEIFVDGEEVCEPGADRGMVFQNYTLFPWLTVLENVRFSQELAGNHFRDGSTAAVMSRVQRVYQLLELMGLADFHKACPRELSGGMKQRVAIARALANDPKVLLMDEPFGALDAQTREEMQELLLLVRLHWRKTIVFVTHDVDEAIFLSDRIIVMSPRPGRVRAQLQVDLPQPRTMEIKLDPEFLRLKREIFGLLHESRSETTSRESLLRKMFKQETGEAGV